MEKIIWIILIMLVAVPCHSAQHYVFIDEDGILTISDRLPPYSVELINRLAHKDESPQDVMLYEFQQKMKQIDSENRARFQQDYNESVEAQKQRIEKYQDQARANRIQRARDDLKWAEEQQEELADRRRNARSQWGTNLWDDIKDKQDKVVSEKRRTLMDLENSK